MDKILSQVSDIQDHMTVYEDGSWFNEYTNLEALDSTCELFTEWCAEQSISLVRFLFTMYVVMCKLDPKKNAMALIGNANAGKTFWIRSMMPKKFGQCAKSRDFYFSDCINQPVILLEEAEITKFNVQDFKNLLGGQDTKVSVKNKGHHVITRTPCLITANADISSLVPDEAGPLNARQYKFQNLVNSDVLYWNPNFVVDSAYWRLNFDCISNYDGILEMVNNPETLPTDSEYSEYYQHFRRTRVGDCDP